MPRPRPAIEKLGTGLLSLAGLLGATGVAVAAAAAHKGGGALAGTAAIFMVLHAGSIVALIGVTMARPRLAGPMISAAGLLLVGSVLFSGDLALAGLLDWRPWPTAAPTGGMLLIAGWLAIPVGLLVVRIRGPKERRSILTRPGGPVWR